MFLSEKRTFLQYIGSLCKLDIVFVGVEMKMQVAGDDTFAGAHVLEKAEHGLVVLTEEFIIEDFGEVV